MQKLLIIILIIVAFNSILFFTYSSVSKYIDSIETTSDISEEDNNKPKEHIKWMEFNITMEIMSQALSYDINSYSEEIQLDWIQLLAYTAAKNWGEIPKGNKSKDLDIVAEKLKNGEKMSDLTKDLKLYPYYLETFSAVLSGFVGEYEIEETDPATNEKIFVKKYGLKAFSPIAKGFHYSHYNDFGVSRSYGYKRNHLGNDLMGNVGTPILAIEDGYVEAIGWNQYGGWRIGIRSFDKKRYYYYAHLRKDHPFVKTLKEGSHVLAGDVIGYLGMTGYSRTENINNIKTPHLHFGLQIIFDESQKDGNNEIWINVYEIIRLLSKNRAQVYKDEITKEYIRSVPFISIPNE